MRDFSLKYVIFSVFVHSHLPSFLPISSSSSFVLTSSMLMFFENQVTDAFVSHLEDILQAGRAASFQRKKLVRARLIIDGTGLGISTLAHLKLIKSITSMGKAYFPEVTASATIVNAPWFFAKIYSVVSPLLTEVMRRKVSILAENFDLGLEAHSGLRRSDLPEFLGGDVSNEQCPEPSRVPRGANQQRR